MKEVNTGLDRLLGSNLNAIKGREIGLITNHTGVTKEFNKGYKLLHRSGVKIKYLFGPEHGFTGARGEGASVPDDSEETENIPIISLYGEKLRPPEEVVKDLDLLIYDIQDLGIRCYTYIYTMVNSLKVAAETGTKFSILDRPPPLSGELFEGKPIEETQKSFIGNYGLPMVYGLSPGELGKYVSDVFQIDIDPEIYRMKGWKRELWFDETDLPWVSPSPGIPDFKTSLVYPATVLFEATNISEGRGTARPFKYFGAPWLDSGLIQEIRRISSEFDLEGYKLRPCHFTPYSSKYKGEECLGYEIYINDRQQIRPFTFGLLLVKVIHDLYRSDFTWWNPSLNRGGPYFDKLAGSAEFRAIIEKTNRVFELLKLAEKGVSDFRGKASNYFLYE